MLVRQILKAPRIVFFYCFFLLPCWDKILTLKISLETKKLAGQARFHVARSRLLRCQRAQQQKHISGCKCHVTAERCASTLFDVPGKSEHNSGCSHDMSYFHDSIHTRTCNAERRRCGGVKLSFLGLRPEGRCVTEPRNCVIYSSQANPTVSTVGGCGEA